MANFPSASYLDKRESVVVYVASENKSMTTTARERKKKTCSLVLSVHHWVMKHAYVHCGLLATL